MLRTRVGGSRVKRAKTDQERVFAGCRAAPRTWLYGPMLALLLALCACGDVAQREYAAGAEAARGQGCECDPFPGDADNALRSEQTAPRSAQWLDGYINACVSLQRVCRTQPAGEANQQ